MNMRWRFGTTDGPAARFAWVGNLLLAGAIASADVAVPPGYYLVEIEEPGTFNSWVSINNHGQFVWSRGYNPFDGNSYEIMMYDHGETLRLTTDLSADRTPDLNNAGLVAWTRERKAGAAADIVFLSDGARVFVTDESSAVNPRVNRTPRLNDSGLIVWSRENEFQCNSADSELWVFDGSSVRQHTEIGRSNQTPNLYSHGEIVWAQADFCESSTTIGVWLSSLAARANLGRISPSPARRYQRRCQGGLEFSNNRRI